MQNVDWPRRHSQPLHLARSVQRTPHNAGADTLFGTPLSPSSPGRVSVRRSEHLLCRLSPVLWIRPRGSPTHSGPLFPLRHGFQPSIASYKLRAYYFRGMTLPPTDPQYILVHAPGWIPQPVYLKSEGTFKSLGVE